MTLHCFCSPSLEGVRRFIGYSEGAYGWKLVLHLVVVVKERMLMYKVTNTHTHLYISCTGHKGFRTIGF